MDVITSATSRASLDGGSVEERRVSPLATALLAQTRSFRWGRELRVALLITSDVVALTAAAAVAYILWALPVRHQPSRLYLELLPVLLLFVSGYSVAGLYPGLGLGPVERLRRLSQTTAFVFLVIASASFSFKLPHLYSRVTFSLALTASLILVPLWRAWMFALFGRWRRWREPVVVVSDRGWPAALAAALCSSPAIGYEPLGYLSLDDSEDADPWCLGALDDGAFVAASGIRVAVVHLEGDVPVELLDRLQGWFRHVIVTRGLSGLPVEGIQVRNLTGALGIEYNNNLMRWRNRLVKRSLDVVLAAVGCMLAAPLIAVAGLCVKLADGGPMLFRQPRTGRRGRRIVMPKIRTMRSDAAAVLEDHLAGSPALRREWEQRLKITADPRVLPGVGSFLRRWSLDELPQLWSVLRGDMSLVGPRPFPDYHLERFSAVFRHLRQRVRPGMTGLWQVTVRSGGRIEDQEAYDSYYIRNWSIWLDVYILCRTVTAVLSGRGAS